MGHALVGEGEDARVTRHTQALWGRRGQELGLILTSRSASLSQAGLSTPELSVSHRELNILEAVLSGVHRVLDVLQEAPSLLQLLDAEVSERPDTASLGVATQPSGHRAGGTLAALDRGCQGRRGRLTFI